MTFKQFMRLHAKDNSAVGQLAQEICADKHFPRSDDYARILDYLEVTIHIGDSGIRRFNEAWKLYAGSVPPDPEDDSEDGFED